MQLFLQTSNSFAKALVNSSTRQRCVTELKIALAEAMKIDAVSNWIKTKIQTSCIYTMQCICVKVSFCSELLFHVTSEALSNETFSGTKLNFATRDQSFRQYTCSLLLYYTTLHYVMSCRRISRYPDSRAIVSQHDLRYSRCAFHWTTKIVCNSMPLRLLGVRAAAGWLNWICVSSYQDK